MVNLSVTGDVGALFDSEVDGWWEDGDTSGVEIAVVGPGSAHISLCPMPLALQVTGCSGKSAVVSLTHPPPKSKGLKNQ